MRIVSSTARKWLVVVTTGAALICVGVMLGPLAESQGLGVAPLLRLAYRPACHQLPDRCLDLGFGPLAVCARCTGLYLGGLLALAATTTFARSVRPSWRWLLAVATPTVIDVTVGLVGVPNLPNWPRFALALPVGLLVGLFLADAFVEAVDRQPGSSPGDPVQ
jgi:uncharacterized membrane protein